MKYLIYAFLIGILTNKSVAQDFINGDLDGNINNNVAVLPSNWDRVPFGDINCHATDWAQATPDLTDRYGPWASTGLIGIPYSGTTFVSGLHGLLSGSGFFYDEGIMQTVSGFNIGCTYKINFFQSVVKQIQGYEDSSGCWAIYFDDNLVGISNPTTDNAIVGTSTFKWEFRSVSFIATATTHTIKFLPADDEADQATANNGGVRMGIDSIYITPVTGIQSLNILGNDTILCVGNSKILNVNILGTSCLWQDNSTIPSLTVTQSGKYWVHVTTNCGAIYDTTNIIFNHSPIDNLKDTTLCEGDTLRLDVTNLNANYLWQDNSTLPFYFVSEPGKYWTQIKNNCGIISDTINISYNYRPILNLGDEASICNGDTLTLDLINKGNSYIWQDNSTNPIFSITIPGIYWAEVKNNCGSTTDSLVVEMENCDCNIYVSNSFTPNNDNLNDRFLPIFDCNLKEYHLTIYNSWGEMIFKTNNQSESWDGLLKSNSVLEGVYNYIITYINKKEVKKVKYGRLFLMK